MILLPRLFAVALPLLLLATGCGSHVINVRLVNESSQTVSTIIIDYPSATFGVNTLAPGQNFRYRLMPSDSGPLKIQFTNAQGVRHNVTGPVVRKNQEGSLEIHFTQDSATATLAQ